MTDDEHWPVDELRRDVRQPRLGSLDHILVALTLGERVREVARTTELDLGGGASRQGAVVALTEPRVRDDREGAIAEGDFGRPNRAGQIRTAHRREVIVPATDAERPGLLFAGRRQADVEPTGREAGLVIEAGCVCLEQEIHAPCGRLRSAAAPPSSPSAHRPAPTGAVQAQLTWGRRTSAGAMTATRSR